jgi:WD40 repeat protein/energy-coupling factor transporter ATP-binding protein EcfA2
VNTFQITVQRKSANGWPIVVEQSAAGVFLPVRDEGVLEVNLDEFKTELDSQTEARAYGTLLGKAMFRDEIRDALKEALAKSDDLHVLLFIEDAEIKGLRWERLCAPLDAGWDFLALNQRAPFSLYLPSKTDRRFPPIGRLDLRALVVVANPEGLDKYRLASFDAAATVAAVRAALGEIPSDVLAAVPQAAGPATLDSLCERITAQRYTLLHIVGHGQFKPGQGETILYLADTENKVEPVLGTRLIGRLKQLRGVRGLPHFIFLSSCESAVAEAGAALGGLAQQLVSDLGMPAVLAMTDKVTIKTAQALAEAFYRRLREHGEPDRALVESCAGLAERFDINVPALYSRLGGRPLFSDDPDRPLTVAEIKEGLGRARSLFAERAPTWLEVQPGEPRSVFDKGVAWLEDLLYAEFEDLGELARKDRLRALDEVGSLCDEALDRSFSEVALGKDLPAYDSRCPFRGMYHFRVEDREFFFGRETLITKLQERLAEANFLAVLGPSGCGKSSLVLAGLVPALAARESHLQYAYLTPGSDPLAFLETVLQQNDRASLLVVDQFEELFTLCTDDAKRSAFLARLLPLTQLVRVVLAMRADFWGECAPYPELKERMQTRQELVAPMDAAELRRAMEKQAAKVGLRFEADLGNTILDDVLGEPGAMPLLQHALLELWKRRHGRWLRTEEYRAIGGVKKAIAETADAVYRDLSPADQERVRDIFMRLTRLDEEAVKAEDRRDTRQRVWLDELTPAGRDPAGVKALVKRLADARLIVTSVNAATGRDEVEVGHEAIIRYWPRLRQWLDEDRANLRVLALVRTAAQEWQKNRADDSLLTHHGARLIDAERFLSPTRLGLNQQEVEYLRACRKRQERHAQRERRYQRWIVGVSATGAIVAIALAAWAWVSRNKAIHLANENERLARDEYSQRVEAQLRLAESLVLQGDVWGSTDRWDLARECFGDAFGFYRQLGIASLPADLGLWKAARTSPQMRTLEGHDAAVQCATFSPNGREAVSGDADGRLILWDTAGRQVVSFHAPPRDVVGPFVDTVYAVAFSPDGRRIVSGHGGNNMLVVLWNRTDLDGSASLRPARIWQCRSDVRCVAFTTDGRSVVAGSGAEVLLFDPNRDEPTKSYVLHDGSVHCVACVPDGRHILSGGDDRTLKLWDVASGKVVREFSGHRSKVICLAVSGDGRRALSGSDDNTVRVWDVASGEEVHALKGHKGPVIDVAFAPDSRRGVSASGDRSLKLWDTVEGRELATYRGHADAVGCAAFSPDGRTLLSGGWDRTLRLWDLTREQHLQQMFDSDYGEGVRVAFLHGGQAVAACTSNRVNIFDVATGRRLAVVEGRYADASFTAGGTLALTVGAKTSAAGPKEELSGAVARLLKIPGGQAVHTFEDTETTFRIGLSADGKRAFGLSFTGDVKVWDLRDRRTVRTLKGAGNVFGAVAMSPDGRLFVAFKAQALLGPSPKLWLDVWDLESGERRKSWDVPGLVSAIAFSPDGRHILCNRPDDKLTLWDVERGERVRTFAGHLATPQAIAFAPDGRSAISGGADKLLKVWDVATAREMATLAGHRAEVIDLTFAPDGRQVLSIDKSGTVIRWDLSWPARSREAAARASQAKSVLANQSDDPSVLTAMSEWYEAEGRKEQAAEYLRQARAAGADVSSLALARWSWQRADYETAEREFRKAVERGEAPRPYLELCLAALGREKAVGRKEKR